MSRILSPPSAMPAALAICALVNAVGTGAFLSGSAAFLLRYLGMSAGQVGVGASITGAAGLVAGVPLGILADRLGGRRGWLLAAAVQAILFVAYPAVPGFAVYLFVAAGLGAAMALADNAEARYLGDVIPDGERVRTSAYLRSVHNAGLAVGTAVAGIALAIDSRPGYIGLAWANAASFLIVGVLLFLFVPEPARLGVPSASSARPTAVRRLPALRDRPLLMLSLLNGVFMLNVPLLLVVFPLWILQRTDAPRVLIALALMLNMALSVLFQVAASRNAEDVGGASAAQRRAGLALAAACALLAFTQATDGVATITLLLLGLIALTGGELFASSAGWGLCYAFAPANRRAEYTAVFRVGSKLAAIVGPALLIPVVMHTGWAGWAGLSVFFMAASAAAMPAVRWASARAVGSV